MRDSRKLLTVDWRRITGGEHDYIQIIDTGEQVGIRYGTGPRVNYFEQVSPRGFPVIEFCAFGEDTTPALAGQVQGFCLSKPGIRALMGEVTRFLDGPDKHSSIIFDASEGYTDPDLAGKKQSICLSKPGIRVLIQQLSTLMGDN